jgi:NitT/TauT family transport system substrate-binding protein
LALGACGGGGAAAPAASAAPKESVKFQLSWLKGGQFAGEFIADAKGYYASEGLNVEFIAGGPTINTIQLVMSDAALIGVGNPLALAIARGQNLKSRAFAATYDKGATSLTCRRESQIKTPADLKGKTIGATPAQRATLESILRLNNVSPSDVNIQPAGGDMSLLVAGRIDCRQTNINDEPLSLQEQGVQSDSFLYYDWGFHQQGDGYFVREENAAPKKDVLTRFTRASVKGWQYALDNPDDAASILTSKYAPDESVAHTVNVIKALKPIISTDRTAKEGLLSLNAPVWQETMDLALKAGSIPAAVSAADMLDTTIYKK